MIHINFHLQKPRHALDSISGPNMWEFWWTQWQWNRYPWWDISVIRCQYHSTMFHTHINLRIFLTRMVQGRSLNTPPQSNALSETEENWI